MSSCGWALRQYNWYPCKKGRVWHRHVSTHREAPCEDTAGRRPSVSQGERLKRAQTCQLGTEQVFTEAWIIGSALWWKRSIKSFLLPVQVLRPFWMPPLVLFLWRFSTRDGELRDGWAFQTHLGCLLLHCTAAELIIYVTCSWKCEQLRELSPAHVHIPPTWSCAEHRVNLHKCLWQGCGPL